MALEPAYTMRAMLDMQRSSGFSLQTWKVGKNSRLIMIRYHLQVCTLS